jgi:transposase
VIQGLLRRQIMPQALLRRERECVLSFVEDEHSRREAAQVFKRAVFTAVRIVRRLRETGSMEAKP